MQKNKLSIHIETRNIYYDNIDTGDYLFLFYRPTRSYKKKLMSQEFYFFDIYEDYIMNYKVKAMM